MSTETQQDSLLAALHEYLQETDFAHLTASDQPDLTALFSDLAGLKTEIKAESRQLKVALDTLNTAVETLTADNQSLTLELAATKERAQKQLHAAERNMLMELIDIYDRFSQGFQALQTYKPVDSLFNHSKKQDVLFIQSFSQGQEITLKRLEQLLQRHRVQVIECAGKAFDAHTMSTVDIGRDPQVANGIVLEELHKGFLFAGEVLRLAEVKVNKL